MCAALRAQGIDVLLATTDAALSDPVELPRARVITHKEVPVILFPSQAGSSFKYSRPFSVWLDQNVVDFDLVAHPRSLQSFEHRSGARLPQA